MTYLFELGSLYVFDDIYPLSAPDSHYVMTGGSTLSCTRSLFQGYREQHILIRPDLDDLRLRQHVVARAHLPPKGCRPVLDIPLEPPRRDDGRLADGDDTNVFSEGITRDPAATVTMRTRPVRILVLVLLQTDTRLAHPDPMRAAALEDEGQRVARDQVHAAVGVGGRLLEQVQVVHLAEPLVDAAAEPADADDGAAAGGGGLAAREAHGLGEVGRVLVRVPDDAAAREVAARLVRERV